MYAPQPDAATTPAGEVRRLLPGESDPLPMDAIGLLLIFPGGLVALALFSGMISLTLGPLLRANVAGRSPSRFMLTDLIWLVAQLQMVMALAARAFPVDMPSQIRVSALVLLCLPVLAFWYASLQVVSWAGVVRPLRRAVVFLLLLPGAALMTLCLPMLALAAIVGLASAASNEPGPHQLALSTAQFALAVAFTVSLRWLANWVVTPVVT